MVNRVELNSWLLPEIRPKVAISGAHPLPLGLLLIKLNSGKLRIGTEAKGVGRLAGNEGRQEKRPGVSLGGGRPCWIEGVSWQIEFAPSFVFQTGFPTTGARLPGVGSARAGQRERGRSRAGSLAGLASLQGKLEKSLEHLQKQMEDALLFQAQAEETCALWQAGGWAPMSRGWGEGSARAHTLEHHRSYSCFS